MKIRTDFVTNSSSSCFIVAFTNISIVKSEVASGLRKLKCLKDKKQVYNDIMRGQITREEAIAQFEHEIEWDAKFAVENELEAEHGYLFSIYEWIENPENKAEFEKRKAEYIAKKKSAFLKRIEGKEFFASIVYSDHDNAELEHMMYSFLYTAQPFSWH